MKSLNRDCKMRIRHKTVKATRHPRSRRHLLSSTVDLRRPSIAWMKLPTLLIALFLPLALHCAELAPLGHYSMAQQQAAAQGAIYGLLAHNAYTEKRRDHFALPPGWDHEWAEGEKPCWGHDGLQYNVHEHRTRGRVDEVVVAFRGTDSKRDWLFGDIGGAQIKLVQREVFPAVLARYPGVKITTTGHSLGGGLALHCALLHPGVSAFVFNTSPHISVGHQPTNSGQSMCFEERHEPLRALRVLAGTARLGTRWVFTGRQAGEHNRHFSGIIASEVLLAGAQVDARLRAVVAKNADLLRRHGHKPAARPLPFLPGGSFHSLLRR